MSQLIIGYVSDNSAKIWVRGLANNESTSTLTAHITLKSDYRTISQKLTIYKHDYFIGIADMDDLNPPEAGFIRVLYTVEVVFKDISGVPIGFPARGSFSTSPRGDFDLNFLLGSSHVLKSPKHNQQVFRNLNAIRKNDKPSLMMHAGNQIFVDVPAGNDPIRADQYINKYLDTWSGHSAGEFFGRVANYMILNDHELFYKYANDVEYDFRPASYYLREGYPSYQMFQHSHNPHTYGADKHYYHFMHGNNAFFVMDTRLERYHFVQPEHGRQMISAEQMEHLKAWLLENRNRNKFIVTAVPFISVKETEYSEYWSAEPYIDQKETLIRFIAQHNLKKIVFLTGQGNAALHSEMKIRRNSGEHVVVHELMTGPLAHYDAALANYDDFIWSQRVRKGDVDYEYNVVSGSAQKDPNVMSISVSGDTLSYRVYTLRYDVDDEEVPGVIMQHSFSIG